MSNKQDKHKLSEIDESISKIYEIKKRLGKGAYGIVWKAVDKRSNQTLAVKKIFDAFRDETDAQRTFREISFLKAFHDHENIIKLVNIHKAENNLDIYLVFEFMESDLHNVIKKGTVLKDIHKRFIMYQLINAVRYIHSGNVIHRDLKPSNVLLDSKCRCKLADFGLARSVSNQQAIYESKHDITQPLLTDYVATRWYRAPEILVASKRYTKGIDMWSLGCILGEMILGKPLFQGSSTVNQIEKIVCALPDVTPAEVNAIGTTFGSALLNKQTSKEKYVSLPQLLNGAPKPAIDLAQSLIVLDPLKRLTAGEALRHPYVEKFQNHSSEIELNADVLPSFRDDVRLTVSEYRSKLYEMARIVDKPKQSSKPHIVASKKSMWDTRQLYCERAEVTRKPSKSKHHAEETSALKQTYKYLSRTEIEMQAKPSRKVITSPVGRYKHNRVSKANLKEPKSLPKLDEKQKYLIARQRSQSKFKAEPDTFQKEPALVQSESEKFQTIPERLQSEPERVQRESERVQREPERVQREHERVQRELERVQKEPDRMQRELDRVQREPDRIQRESNRIQREPDRVQREPDRVQREPDRVHRDPDRVQREHEKIQREPDWFHKVSECFQKDPETLRKDHEIFTKVSARIQNQPTKIENLVHPKKRLSLDSSLIVQAMDVKNNTTANDVSKTVTALLNYSLSKPEAAARFQQEELGYHSRPSGDAPRLEIFERVHRSSPMLAKTTKHPMLFNTRSELSTLADLRTPDGTGYVCYEQRLQQLEAEIDQYKSEVKSFCKTSGNYVGGQQYSRVPVNQSRNRFNEQPTGRNGTAYNNEPAIVALNRGSGDHIRYEQKSNSKDHPQQHQYLSQTQPQSRTKPKSKYF